MRRSLDAEFRAVFRAEFGYVWNSLRRLGVQQRDLDDVAVEVFLVIHKHYASYDRARPLRPWLFAFAVHAASDYRRLARHREVSRDEIEKLDSAPSIETQLVAREDRALVLAALDGIDIDRRSVFIMHEIDEVSVPDIAVALRIPLNTAYSRLRLARKDFEEAARRLTRAEATPGPSLAVGRARP